MIPPTRYVQPQKAAEIVRLRRQGKAIGQITQATGRSHKTICSVLQAAGVPRTRAEYRPSRTMARRCTRIIELARRGQSQAEVAEQMGLTPTQVNGLMSRRGLFAEQGLTLLSELANDLGLTEKSIVEAISTRRLEASRWFTRVAFTAGQVQAARAHYAEYRPVQDVEGWLSSRQVARELGMDVDTFLKRWRAGDARTAGIRRVRVSGANGRAFRYHPHDVQAAASKLPGRNLPLSYAYAGMVQAQPLATMAGRSHDAVNIWAKRGCPHNRDRKSSGRLWFAVSEVLAWLDVQADPRYAEAAANLRAALASQRAAA